MLSYFQNASLEGLNRVEKKKHRSKQRIIETLYLHGESDCTSIAQNVSLSIPSSQASINELLCAGIVEEKGQGSSTGGRRPTIYGLKSEAFYILCIDVGRFHVRFTILDSNLTLKTGIATHEIKFQDSTTYLDKIYEYGHNLIETTGIKNELLIGVGLSMPGAIDSIQGINYSYFFNPEETLTAALEKRFSLPVFLENDTNVLALAELWYGQARNKENALVLLLSWGIGLGLILNGKLYRGASGFAGEFSHIPAVENGKLCWCNKQGCLETVASATALSALVKEGIDSGKASSIFESIDISKEYISPNIVIAAANQGDQFAVNILSEIGHELGKGIASLIQILNPEIIILGGRMSKAKQYIITPIQQALNSHCNPLLTNNINIVSTNLGEEAIALGLAIMVVNKLLSSNGCF
jgi:N-acetylglucosamine repressor